MQCPIGRNGGGSGQQYCESHAAKGERMNAAHCVRSRQPHVQRGGKGGAEQPVESRIGIEQQRRARGADGDGR